MPLQKTINVLFLCKHNSARSIMAEALLNQMGKGRFKAFSAGSNVPANHQPNPYALALLRASGIPALELSSKAWDEFAKSDAPEMDLIITVCDETAGEVCPVWPGHPATAHWSCPDPVAAGGTEAEKVEAFRLTLHGLRRRLELLVNLPADSIDGLVLQTHARELAAA